MAAACSFCCQALTGKHCSLACGHVLHFDCIQKSVDGSLECAVCLGVNPPDRPPRRPASGDSTLDSMRAQLEEADRLKGQLVRKAWELYSDGVKRESQLMQTQIELEEAENAKQTLQNQVDEMAPQVAELDTVKQQVVELKESNNNLIAKVQALVHEKESVVLRLKDYEETHKNLLQQVLELQEKLTKEEDKQQAIVSSRDSLMKQLQHEQSEARILQERLHGMKDQFQTFRVNTKKIENLEEIVREMERERKESVEKMLEEQRAREQAEVELRALKDENSTLKEQQLDLDEDSDYEHPTRAKPEESSGNQHSAYMTPESEAYMIPESEQPRRNLHFTDTPLPTKVGQNTQAGKKMSTSSLRTPPPLPARPSSPRLPQMMSQQSAPVGISDPPLPFKKPKEQSNTLFFKLKSTPKDKS